jgi:hypothetical protein
MLETQISTFVPLSDNLRNFYVKRLLKKLSGRLKYPLFFD